ncbi:hypothetical protein EWB00_001361, partial [Schistosoma japonicum]
DAVFGLFKYSHLLFGLSCSPAIFQEVMNSIVSYLKGVEVYKDDLIIHGPDKTTQDKRLTDLLRRLREKNIAYLGYLVDCDGFRPDPKP